MMTEPKPAAPLSTAITENPAHLPLPPAPTVVDPPPPAPPLPETPPTWPVKVDFAILALLFVLSFFLASFEVGNSDLWLNLAIGKRYSEGKFDFGVDPFSWATEAVDGKPAVYWVHHSWLYSWLVYGIYSLWGGAGLVIGKAIVFTAAIAILSRVGWNQANRWFVLVCLMMAALAISNRMRMQPIVLSMLFLSDRKSVV